MPGSIARAGYLALLKVLSYDAGYFSPFFVKVGPLNLTSAYM